MKFTEEALQRISAATYVGTFANSVAFMETLQRRKMTSLSSCNIWPSINILEFFN